MIEANESIYKDCISKWSNFETLNEEELEKISLNQYEPRLKAGEIILKQGSPTPNSIFIVSDLAKAYMEGYGNNNMNLSIAKPGQLIVSTDTYVDSRHHYPFATLSHTMACFLDMGFIKKTVANNSQFIMEFFEDISFKALRNFNKLINFNQHKMHGRLVKSIIHLANHIFESDEFACLLNRKEFNDKNSIEVKQNAFKILNKERLQKFMILG